MALIKDMFISGGTGAQLGMNLWNITTPPLFLGDASFIGWKAAGITGLMAESLTTAANTSTTVNSQTTEYDTRDHILNRVVTVAGGVSTGFAPAATNWDVSALATAFGAPPLL